MGKRINFVFTLFFFFFLLILFRLFFWQILSAENLGSLAERQRSTKVTLKAPRGNIFASDGSPLVINQTTYDLFLEPKKIKEPEKVISALVRELEIPSSSISAKLKNSSSAWLPLVSGVEEEKAERLRNLKLPGIGFVEATKRFYPEASMAAHLLGFVGKNAKGENQGYFGLEGFYDEQLRGRDGFIDQEVDVIGNPILAGDQTWVPAQNGRDLTLYLDKTVQYIVEKKLKEGIERYKALGGNAIVIDPKTGGIIAMASFPSYDPGEYYKYPTEFYKNPAVSLSFEPGSTFKVLVMAMALNEGKITHQTKYNETGPVEIGDKTVNTWNQKYHGEITMTQILEYSSNVGMVFVANQLEKEVFLNYLEKLGLGSLTGIDLQEEASPALRQKSKWYEIDYATVSFGQGISATPLQMIRDVAALANQGELLEPHVVKQIRTGDGKTVDFSPRVIRKIFKPEAARLVTEMMVSAVDNGETRLIKPSGYRIAGKTGTAQIPIAGHYDTEKTIASFIGFAPVDNPKFVMLITLKEPGASPWGSETAAPVFFSIAKELFSYFKISPSE